jgi:uncharacterized protein (TIGR03437 family)
VSTAKLLRLTLAACAASAAWAGTFGKVVQIGGHASDIALDDRRGVLYVANFTANRIEVVSTYDHSLQRSISVPPQPGAIALSPDNRYLVVAHYAEWVAPVTIEPAITILDLDAGTKLTLAMGASPLAVAFGGANLALVISKTGFQLLDPATGVFQDLEPRVLDGADLPAPLATFPPQIVQASVGISGDKRFVIGLAAVDKADQKATLHFRYDVVARTLDITGITAEPPLGPRVVSVDREGRTSLLGWGLFDYRHILMAQFPYPTGDLNVGGHAFDWSRSLIYAQIPEAAETTSDTPTTPPTNPPSAPQASPKLAPPVLHVVDSDNLTVRERLQLPENLAGKSLLSSDLRTMYALSDSGLLVLPIASLTQTPRVVASKEDVLFRGNFCDRRVTYQEIDIVDPGGGNTDFKLTVKGSNVTVSPSSGTTPARVRIGVDLNAFQNMKGTAAVTIEITSQAGVNVAPPVRVLINTREPEQRGALFNVPGKLVDILADPIRNRFYVIRQDRNQMLVFDATSFSLLATLRTGNTPTQMAMTMDRRFLMVGNDNSQIANVYDLDALQPVEPIVFPFGHYPRSVAVSNRAILGAVRGVSPGLGCPAGPGLHTIDRVDFETRTATTLPSLGVYCNDIPLDTVLAGVPSGSKIFGTMPDGTVLLYEAEADTFVVSRKDFDTLGGAYAALTDQVFVADNILLNGSLVPFGELETTTGSSSGFTILDGLGLRTTASSSSAPGVIQRVDLIRQESIRPTKMIEAPLLAESMLTPAAGQIGQTIQPFTRTLIVPANRGSIISLSTSGFTVLPWDFDAAVVKPSITSVINLADGSAAIAPGGLVSVLGNELSRVTVANNELPVPTTLGEACLTVNNVLAPLFLVSPGTINAQLPFEVSGSASMVLRTPGGTSDPFTFNVFPTAPAVFHTGSAGPDTGLATIYRAKNHDLVTLSNPVHPEDYLTIYVTGLGRTSPAVATGAPAPADPLAIATQEPVITLGGVVLPIQYAGLVPGLVGVYQINVYVPQQVPRGMEVPLTISRPYLETSFTVRVVK